MCLYCYDLGILSFLIVRDHGSREKEKEREKDEKGAKNWKDFRGLDGALALGNGALAPGRFKWSARSYLLERSLHVCRVLLIVSLLESNIYLIIYMPLGHELETPFILVFQC